MISKYRIDERLIQDGLDEIDEGAYLGTIRRLMESKLGSIKGTKLEKKAKVYRYMAGKGFESGIFMPVLSEMLGV